MQVTELESKGLKRTYRIVVDAASINAETEAQLRSAGERVKIPGFRPGFIPMKILQQRYGKSVQADVLKNALNRASTDAVNEKKLRPALMPQVNIEEYKDGGELTFTMTLEVFPEIPDIAYNKLTLDRKTFEVAEKDVDEALARIAERSPSLERVKEGTKAQDGSVLTIDFKGSIDGKLFDGGSADNFRLELGSKQFIEGFEEQLIGAKEGEERDVNVTFPKDYPAGQLADKAATFAVTVKEIYSKQLPAINEEFAKSHGFADEKALREAVRSQIVKEYNQAVRAQLKKQLFDQLENEGDFDLPQGMVDLEFNSIWERVKEAQARGEETLGDKSEDELKKEYQQIALRRVKLGLILAEVGTRNKLQISREELSRAAMQQASQFPGQERKVMEFYQKNPDRIDDLRGPILEEKAVDFILGQVKYNDHKVALDEIAEDEDDEESSEKKPAKSKSSKSKSKKKASGE